MVVQLAEQGVPLQCSSGELTRGMVESPTTRSIGNSQSLSALRLHRQKLAVDSSQSRVLDPNFAIARNLFLLHVEHCKEINDVFSIY